MPFPVKGLLKIYENMPDILLILKVFLAVDPEIEYLLSGAPNQFAFLQSSLQFGLWLESVQDDINMTL